MFGVFTCLEVYRLICVFCNFVTFLEGIKGVVNGEVYPPPQLTSRSGGMS